MNTMLRKLDQKCRIFSQNSTPFKKKSPVKFLKPQNIVIKIHNSLKDLTVEWTLYRIIFINEELVY